MDTVSGIMQYEAGEMSADEIVEFFQHLLDTGIIYSLQGSYQRMLHRLIESGEVTA